jgi:basic amino acid/polyamine antiporter, APA family
MPKLKRTLGLASVTFYGVGLILGAGIYSIIGDAAGPAGSSLWLAFLIAASVALLTALSYAELSTMFPEAGAEYVYIGRAFPQVGWARRILSLLLIGSGIATSATVATAFAGYAGVFLEASPLLVGAGLLLCMAALNIVGIRQSSWVNIAFTLAEIGGLGLAVAAGLQHPEFGEALTAPMTPGVFAAAGLVFFAFLGFEDIANLAEETREPATTLPRALLFALLISSVLYVAVALAVVVLRPPAELAESSEPLAYAVSARWQEASGWMAGIALFATANTALVAMIAASRMLMAMGRQGDLPKFVGKVLPKRRSPWLGALVVLAVAIGLLFVRDTAILGGISSFGALLAFASVNFALVALRRKSPETERPFRVPLTLGGWPVPSILGLLGAVGLAAVLPRTAWYVGAIYLFVLVLAEIARHLFGLPDPPMGKSAGTQLEEEA